MRRHRSPHPLPSRSPTTRLSSLAVTKYNRKQIEAFARAAGFRGAGLVYMPVIALAESGGDSDARGPKEGTNSDGSVDWGLWQINSIHQKDHPTWSEAWLKNPQNNAQAAFILSGSGKNNLKPWDASKEKWAPIIGAPTGINTPGEIVENIVEDTPIVSDTIDGIGNIAQAVGKGAGWISTPRNWLRVGFVVGGFALAISGAVVLVGPAKVSSVLPAGKVLKSVKGKSSVV